MLKYIDFQEYPNHKDIIHIRSTVCDSAVVDDERNPRVQEEVIKKGHLFETLDAVKFFFSGLHCTLSLAILYGQVKQKCKIHYEVPNFELQLGCMATLYEK
jgi:hypothetical protein